MKQLFALLLSLLALGACKTIRNQMYEMQPVPNASASGELQLSYNFWGNGLAPQIVIHNTTDSLVTIDWTKSSYVVNQFAHPYYDGTTTTLASSAQSSSSVAKSSTGTLINAETTQSSIVSGGIASQNSSTLTSFNSMTRTSLMYTTIPPKAKIFITSPLLFEALPYDICNKETMSPTLKFTNSNTVLTYRNYITYMLGSSKKLKALNDEFFLASTEPIKGNAFHKEVERCNPEYSMYYKTKVLVPPSPFHFYSSQQISF